MKLIMQTPYSKMNFELTPDQVGELVQAAFRYSSGMAQLEPGWSDGIVYQEGMEAVTEPDEPAGDGAPDAAVPYAEECEAQEPLDIPAAGNGQPGPGMETEVAGEGADGSGYQEAPAAEDAPAAQPEAGHDGSGAGDAEGYGPHEEPEWEQAERQPDAASKQGEAHVQPPMQPKYGNRKYAGFMYIQCQGCGKRKGFRPKAPIDTHICDCGWKTPLEDIAPAYAQCKCGKTWKYKTNVMDNFFEIDCLACGSPIDLEYNKRKGVYATVRDRD